MAEFKYLDIDCAAWVRDTHHLSRLARGLYMDMIILCWSMPKCLLPADLAELGRLLRCSRAEMPVLKSLIEEFWETNQRGIWLHQKRLVKEWKASLKRKAQAQYSANSRWDKGKNTSSNASTVTETGTALVNPLKRGLSNAVPRGARARSTGGSARAPAPQEGIPPENRSNVSYEERMKESRAFFKAIEDAKAKEEPDDDQTKH